MRYAGGRMAPLGGRRIVPLCAVTVVGLSPFDSWTSLGQEARARCPFSWGAGGAGLGATNQHYSAHSCDLALPA